jgi:hypothetical protein
MNQPFDPSHEIVKTQQLLQQGLADLERSLRSLTLMAAQASAELRLQARRIDLLNGRIGRIEASLERPQNG